MLEAHFTMSDPKNPPNFYFLSGMAYWHACILIKT